MVKISAQIEGEGSKAFTKRVSKAVAKSRKIALQNVGAGFQQEIRQDIEGAGLGVKLGNAVRLYVQPQNTDYALTPSAEVRAARNAANIIQSFDQGAVITASGGRKYLAIPTDKVPRGRWGAALTPRQVAARYGAGWDLKVMPGIGAGGNRIFKRAAAALVLTNRALTKKGRIARKDSKKAPQDIIMFWLVATVHMPKKLAWGAKAEVWKGRLQGEVDAALAVELSKGAP